MNPEDLSSSVVAKLVTAINDGDRAAFLAQLTLYARYRNDTWGAMSTVWQFRLTGDKISRIDTGQA
jgi:hypothetical protein